MRPPAYSWPDTGAGRGILMLAQLMREMLNDQTFESFRAYTLDTVARLDEAIEVADDVRQGRIPGPAIDPIQAELAWSLKKDPIVNDLAESEGRLFCELAESKRLNHDEITIFATLLRKRLGKRYKELCEAKIIELYPDNDKRIALRHTVGFYCSHLINAGYSKAHVLECVETDFFSHKMQRVTAGLLRKFFRRFDCVDRKFSVCLSIDTEFGNYLKKLKFDVYRSLKDLPTRLRPIVGAHLPIGVAQSYLAIEAKEFDQFKAAEFSESVISYCRAVAFVGPHNMNCEWGPSMCIVKARSNRGSLVKAKRLPLQRRTVPPSAARKAVRDLVLYSGRVMSSFEPQSTFRLLGSLNTSALAHSSSAIESQLISLWSSIEVLLSEPQKGTARILHYIDLLRPCICIRYMRRQFIAVFNEMLVSYRRSFTSIVSADQQIQGTDQHTKFAAVLLLPANNALRDQLVTLCEKNPLALHRLWKLRRDYSEPSNIKNTLEGHEHRVEWQLNRIYRARNSLVHSARKPKYLDSLVLSLDEFFRATFTTIMYQAKKAGGDSNIDQIVSEIGIEYKIYMRYMALLKQNTHSIETFRQAIS